MLSGELPKRTEPSRVTRASRFDVSFHFQVRVPKWRSTSSDCSTRLTPNAIVSRPNRVGRATPFENCRHGEGPLNPSDTESGPGLTVKPPPRGPSLPPGPGRAPARRPPQEA